MKLSTSFDNLFLPDIREALGLSLDIHGPVSSGLGLDHQEFPSLSLGLKTETDSESLILES